MKKKILALCLVIVLAVTAVTGVTLAYFTDTTEVVKNTFTMGKVKIALDEAKVNENGVATAERVKKNDYTDAMVPGHVFPKDPTIHVEAGSEKSYIFLDVTINKFNSLAWVMAANEGVATQFTTDGKFSSTAFLASLVANKELRIAVIDKWIDGIEHEKWTIANIFVNGDELTVRLAYNTIVDAKADQVNIVFMDSFQMPETVTQEMIESGKTDGGMQNNFNTDAVDFKMNFVAHAIQADKLDTVKDAYVAMFDPDTNMLP